MQVRMCCTYSRSGISGDYSQPVGEGGGLGGGRQRNWRREATLHGLDGLESRTAPESLVQVESQSAGSHCGQLEWVGGGRGDGEKSWTRPEVEVRKSNCSPSSSANHMTRFSKPPLPSRLLPCLLQCLLLMRDVRWNCIVNSYNFFTMGNSKIPGTTYVDAY